MILSKIETEEFERYFARFDFSKSFAGKTILVTGANGMTGQAFIKWLLLLGNCKIYASTRHPERIPSFVEKTDNVTFVKFGEEGLIAGRIDYILHAASPTQRTDFINTPVETIKIIIEGTIRILELAKAKKSKVLYLSSCEVYGAANSENCLKEDYIGAIDSLNIRSSYPLSKKEAELLCHAYYKEYGVATSIARISAIQGLYQAYNSERVESEVLRCVLESKNLVMKSDGLTKKSFVYTLDVVSGLLFILLKGLPGEVYNLTNNETYLCIKDLAQTVFDSFNQNCKIEFANCDNNGFLKHLSYTQDVSKLKNLGWEPITSLKKVYEIDIERFTNE